MNNEKYWWDYFNIKKPSYVSGFKPEYYSTLISNSTGININVINSTRLDAPMWTDIYNNTDIFYNPNHTQIHYTIYHEAGHLIGNSSIFKNGTHFDNFIKAEMMADMIALNLSIRNNDEDAITDLLNILIIDRVSCKYYDRKEHYYARNTLLANKQFINLCKCYCNFDELLEYGKKWEIILDNNKTGPIKIINI